MPGNGMAIGTRMGDDKKADFGYRLVEQEDKAGLVAGVRGREAEGGLLAVALVIVCQRPAPRV